MNKKQLAIILSQLKTFDTQNIILEQYQTDSDIAAEVLWFAFMQNDIKNKTIADLGCGTGLLGIGALLLGAKQVYFTDIDPQALTLTKKNLNSLKLKNAVLQRNDIEEFQQKVDTVIQNPPFGVQTPYADRPFLKKAFQIANSIYSIHKTEAKKFIQQIKPPNFTLKHILTFKLPIKQTQKFHKKPIHQVQTSCFVLKRNL